MYIYHGSSVIVSVSDQLVFVYSSCSERSLVYEVFELSLFIGTKTCPYTLVTNLTDLTKQKYITKDDNIISTPHNAPSQWKFIVLYLYYLFI